MIRALAASMALMMSGAGMTQEVVKVYAAGSLREAMGALARAFESAGGAKVEFTYGASGLLRERLAGGEKADVFASANTEHPQALVASGRATDTQPFAGNRMCALAQPGIAVTPDTLLDVLLDPAIRLATSTPKADPSGDYAWQLFDKAEKIRPGAFETLSRKANQLVGGPASAPTPAGRTAYGYWMEQRVADIFLTYCTNAVQARREVPARIVEAPPALAVGAVYGVALMSGASPGGRAFRDYLLSPAGRAILVAQGFSAPR